MSKNYLEGLIQRARFSTAIHNQCSLYVYYTTAKFLYSRQDVKIEDNNELYCNADMLVR